MRALHGETEGNPFFIEEVVRHLRESEHELHADISLTEAGVPDGVREVTARRLRRLDPESRQALQFAAVIGREFDYDVLEAVAPIHDDALIAALEDGVDARVLRETGRVGRYAFTHALVRATLYDGLSRLRRARLHGRVGEAIVRLRGSDLDPYLPQLAFHFAQAAPVEQPDRAIDYALAAARRADRLLAWEEAAQHYRAALRARDLTGAREDPVRAELLLAQGDLGGPGRARGRGAGDVPGCRGHARGCSATRRCWGAPRSASPASGRCWAAWTRSGWRCSRRRSRRSARRTARCARGCWRGSRSSSTTRAIRTGGRRCPSRRSSSRGGSGTRGRWPRASTLGTTRCGGRRRSTSGSRSPPSCAGWPSRPAMPSSSSRARAGRSSTCSSSATWWAQTSRSRPRPSSRTRCSDRCGCGGRCSCAARAHR